MWGEKKAVIASASNFFSFFYHVGWRTPLRNVLVGLHLINAQNLTKLSASQNEATVKNLRLGLILPTVLSLLLRLLFRRDSLPPSKSSLAIYLGTFFPAFFLSNYLVKIGTTRRDPTTGTLISYGEDLNQPGLTEWAFDILYITCKSHLVCKAHLIKLLSL